MREYIALVHRQSGTDYGVSFPDFPGVVTAGRNLDEARAMAAEALELHMEGMVQEGEVIPEPSSLEIVKSDPEYRDCVAFLAVPVKTGTHGDAGS